MLYRENGQFKSTYRTDQQIFPILQDRVAIGLLLAFAFIVIPLIASPYLLTAILIPFLILSLAALGLNILVGYCGQISLGSRCLHGGGRLRGLQLPRAHRRHAADRVTAGRRCGEHGVRRAVRCAFAAHQGPVSGGRDTGRAVLRRLGLSASEAGSRTDRPPARSVSPGSMCSACRSRRRCSGICSR